MNRLFQKRKGSPLHAVARFFRFGRSPYTGNDMLAVSQAEIAWCIRSLTGVEADMGSVEEIKGGTRKKVLKVRCRKPEIFLLYVWYNENRYFTGIKGGGERYMFDLRAPDLYAKNTEFLNHAGIRVPKILGRGILRSGHEYAFVEHIGGGNCLQYAAARPADEKKTLLARIDELFRSLHSHQREYPGLLMDPPGRPTWSVESVLHKLKHDIELLARWHKEIKAVKQGILVALERRRRAVPHRLHYSLVHGEASPEHILVDQGGNPYLIDLDSVHYSDIESDYASLELLFGEDYHGLRRDDLDPHMMDFYRTALHIAYARGASQLVRKGYHDPDMAKRMMDKNLSAILAIL